MTVITIHEAKTHFSSLLRRAVAGEEIVIARGGTPIARIVPVDQKPVRQLGLDQGKFEVPEDFDAPLPEDLLSAYES